ncbi:uncharacterized protein [Coffea arabica]|uniref:Small multi-drug export protein n=1 Tax=Coffea arabica TaxID=13443 RepID=A0A6P6VC99_COFAR|nr:uncharacterized protein LOC113719538 [Coffea arabica]
MAASLSNPPMLLTLNHGKSHFKVSFSTTYFHLLSNKQIPIKFKPFSTFHAPNYLGQFQTSSFPILTATRASSNDFLKTIEEKDRNLANEERPVKFLFWVLFWASVSIGIFAVSGDARAAVDSIRASSFGLKVATALRGFGWPDEAVVFALATLPVIELRGAIPVGYWLQLKPVLLTVLSILGNMVPVPFIILYLKKFATFLAGKNQSASQFLEMLFERAKKKAGPVEEFQWLGLMLFVAVPFPGTGAWTGAIIASVLDMPFWSGFLANFVGVVLAGLLVNLLVNLGLKYAVITGVILFFISTFMWSILRGLKKSLSSTN